MRLLRLFRLVRAGWLLGWLIMSAQLGYGQVPVVLRVSEGVRPGGLVALYGEGLTGPGVRVKFDPAGTIVSPVAQDGAGQFAHVVLPPALPAGAYAVSASNDDGATWSAPVFLNRADPRWLSETSAYPGLPLRLLGRNLQACQFNASGRTELQLVPAAGGSPAAAVPDLVTPYAVSFRVPAGLATGSYYLEVRTQAPGLGAAWVRHAEPLVVGPAPTDPLALALGVSWARDYAWATVRNARTDFGARGDGTGNDTPALQRAIDQVAALGGGVVYLPAGTYPHTGLVLQTGVVLRGQTKASTVLRYVGSGTTVAGGGGTPFRGGGAGTGGLASLTLTADQTNPGLVANATTTKTGWLSLSGERFFLYDLDVELLADYLTDWGWVIFSPGKLLLANCSFQGTAFYCPDNPQIQFRNNTVTLRHSEISLWGARSLFIGNHVIGQPRPAQTNYLHGFFVDVGDGDARDLYYYDNLVEDVQSASNQGEAFSTDGVGTYATGPVVSSQASQLTLRPDYLSGRGWATSFQVLVVRGRGLGQKRNITTRAVAGANLVLTLDRPWDVLPDATSKCVVANFAEDIVVEKMTATRCTVGLQYYTDGYDNVMANNVLTDTQGLLTWTFMGAGGLTPSYFCTTRDNQTRGASPQYGNTWLGIRAEATAATNDYAASAYGLEYRANTVDRLNYEDGYNNIPGSRPTAIALGYNDGAITGGRGVLATLLEENVLQNSAEGLRLTPGVANTVLRATAYLNISGRAYQDQGSATTVLAGAPAAALGCPPVGPLPVTLLDFSATRAGAEVALRWHTASEQNSQRFDLERSLDGTVFSPLATLPAAGNATTQLAYAYADDVRGVVAATLYYRLRLVDLDGRTAFSPVRTVANPLLAGPARLSAYPNPGRERLTLLAEGLPPGPYSLAVFNAIGQQVLATAWPIPGPTAQLQVRLPAGLPAGLYQIRLTNPANSSRLVTSLLVP